MKKSFVFVICMLLLVQFILPVSATAATDNDLIYREETILENGLTVVDEIYANKLSRASVITGERKKTIKSGDTTLGIIAFQATFRYDGSNVAVVSKTVTQSDAYEGYSYKQNSFTSSGGTVTLEGKLTKLLIFNQAFTMSLMCDINGNLSAA